MTTIPARYLPHRVRCTGVLEAEGWRLKVYEFADDLDRPRRDLVEAAEGLVRRLPQPPDAAGRYGVGFLCVHDARDGCHAFVAWWANGTMLHQRAYVAPQDHPDALTPAEPDGPIVGMWNIPVIAFERGAWLDALADPGVPDLERYLDSTMGGEV